MRAMGTEVQFGSPYLRTKNPLCESQIGCFKTVMMILMPNEKVPDAIYLMNHQVSSRLGFTCTEIFRAETLWVVSIMCLKGQVVHERLQCHLGTAWVWPTTFSPIHYPRGTSLSHQCVTHKCFPHQSQLLSSSAYSFSGSASGKCKAMPCRYAERVTCSQIPDFSNPPIANIVVVVHPSLSFTTCMYAHDDRCDLVWT